MTPDTSPENPPAAAGTIAPDAAPAGAGDPGLTRAEKLLLTAAALRGTFAGAARAIITWLIEHHTH